MAKKKEEVKENVINIDGQEFTEKSLSQPSKYFIAQIKDLEAQQKQPSISNGSKVGGS